MKSYERLCLNKKQYLLFFILYKWPDWYSPLHFGEGPGVRPKP
jgi:hypothetical protein